MIKMDLKRPLSWSSLSSFEYDKEAWYEKYILKRNPAPNKEMVFGKKFANSVEAREPLAPVTIYKEVEYPLNVMFGEIPLIGFIDSYEPHTHLIEYKTGKKEWDQKRVDEHGQIDMYLLMLFIQHKVKPESLNCSLQWVPTVENGDFTIDFKRPITVVTFSTKRTMKDILKFGSYIQKTYADMQKFVKKRSKIITKIN